MASNTRLASFLWFAACLASITCTSWVVLSPETNQPCVRINGSITFDITYTKADKQQTTYSVEIPPEDTSTADPESSSVEGACYSGTTATSSMNIKWTPVGKDGLKCNVSIVFKKNDVQDIWFTESLELTFNTKMLADIGVTEYVDLQYNQTEHLFDTRIKRIYKCNATQEFTMVSDSAGAATISVKFTTKDLAIEPFEGMKKIDQCSLDPDIDPQPNPTTPPPPNPTAKPTQPTPSPGTPGSKVAWACTIVSLVLISILGVIIYVNRDSTPSYLRVV
jgi:hypothetical protein